MKRIIVIATLALAGLSFACYKVNIKSGAPPAGQEQVETKWHFIGGLTSASVSAPQCRNGISSVEVSHPWWSWGCVIPITGGLVAASSTKVVCAQASRAEVIDDLGKSTAIASVESSVLVGEIGLGLE